MRAWFACSGAELLRRGDAEVAGALARAQMARRYSGEPAQLAAWEVEASLLRNVVRACGGEGWTLAFEFDLLRLEKRIDVVLLTDRAIVVLEFKVGARAVGAGDRAQVEDYALDLRDFHAGSQAHPIIPVVVATECRMPARFQRPLGLPDVVAVAEANAATLAALLRDVQQALPAPAVPLDGAAWLAAAYQPVPSIIEAAATLFERNSVAELAEARADAANLQRTTAAINRALEAARARDEKLVVFVTGIPGAGKTLCGLNVVFGEARRDGSAFLTGNAPLVAVLREALACNRAGISLELGPSNDPERRKRGPRLEQARRETLAALQNVHRFLADNANKAEAPAERVIVFDEAQRAWDQAQATRDTQRRVSTLSRSEPAHTLDIMGRHAGFAAVVALIGGGQEINTGEAGLAEWGQVIAAAPAWRAVAAPRVLNAAEPAQRLAAGAPAWLSLDAGLDLTVPMRSVRDNIAAAWVDAVLRDAPAEAAGLAATAELPFLLTRSLAEARAALRALAKGRRRAGFVRSSGARRLRGEGFDAQLLGSEEPVAWFLERWPDIRASDALEVAATEYACQGLELDVVGLAWGGDFLRQAPGWLPRRFAGNGWQVVKSAEDQRFIHNTYRVLLTRARYETVIWVPPGDADDRTRPPAEMDAIAAFLLACGARPLAAVAPVAAAPAPARL